MEANGTNNPARVIGLDLGGTKLAAASFVCSGDGVVLECALQTRKYDSIFRDLDPGELTSLGKSKMIEAAMVGAVRELSDGPEEPAALGICSAGFVENGYIIEAWNTGMQNYPLKKNLEDKTGLRTFLYKDSWAPVFALRPEHPAIIFSIGTGFGGVSCETDLSIPIRSYTASRRFKWIPYLCCNDDPGYAVSFSDRDIAGVVRQVLSDMKENMIESDVPAPEPDPAELAAKVKAEAKKAERMTPSKIELFMAKGLAFKAMERMRPDEVFADFVGAASFPGLLYKLMSSREPDPHQLDKLLVKGDPFARTAFLVQAELIGHILYEMQKERIDRGLESARRIYATGSGYNEVNHEVLSGAIAAALTRRCKEKELPAHRIESVRLIRPDNPHTTFACTGAASGAALGIE